MKRLQWKAQFAITTVYLVASENHLEGIFWRPQPGVQFVEDLLRHAPAVQILSRATQQLEQYFRGQRKQFDLPLNAQGTAFQMLVWSELAKIKYGTTASYKDIAVRIQNERAVRAVGTANGKNPLSIVIPCHRVIASDQTLGGYAGGLEVKAKLLDLEKGLK